MSLVDGGDGLEALRTENFFLWKINKMAVRYTKN